MSSSPERSRVRLDELLSRVRPEMVPLSQSFSYFSVTPLGSDEVHQYLEEPLAALPPALAASLPRIEIVLAPFLERANGRGDYVCFERPPDHRQIPATRLVTPDAAALAFAIKEEDIADYHYAFYNAIAGLVRWEEQSPARKAFTERIREELRTEVHGEVDDKAWQRKQALLRRPSAIAKEGKIFNEYVHQAFEDTFTLYLHGICCDIDVEPGPRQMPSRHLRRRLELLAQYFPPPAGYAVLPEQTRRR